MKKDMLKVECFTLKQTKNPFINTFVSEMLVHVTKGKKCGQNAN